MVSKHLRNKSWTYCRLYYIISSASIHTQCFPWFLIKLISPNQGNKELMKLISFHKYPEFEKMFYLATWCLEASLTSDFRATVVFFVCTTCRVVFPTNRLSWSSASKPSPGSLRTGELGKDIALSNASSIDKKLDSWWGLDLGLDSALDELEDRLMLNSHSLLDVIIFNYL